MFFQQDLSLAGLPPVMTLKTGEIGKKSSRLHSVGIETLSLIFPVVN